MGPSNLSMKEKGVIVKWKAERVSTKVIARRMGRGESTIRRLWAAAKGLPPYKVPPTKTSSGRPRKTSKTTDTLMKIEVMKDPRVTANELKKKHPELLEGVSERTIQHRLQKELELPTRKPAVKPFLTKQMTKKRLEFARKYKHWTEEDWHKTSRIAISSKHGVKRPKVVEESESSDSEDDYEIEIKREEDDYLYSSNLEGDSFMAYPDDKDSMEIKEEDLDAVDIKEEVVEDWEAESSAEETKTKETKRKGTKRVKFSEPEPESDNSDLSESDSEEDNFADDDSAKEKGEDKKSVGSGLANDMAKILGTKKSEDVILSKAKTDKEVKKTMKLAKEDTFEVVDSNDLVKEPTVETKEEEEDRKLDISLHDREIHAAADASQPPPPTAVAGPSGLQSRGRAGGDGHVGGQEVTVSSESDEDDDAQGPLRQEPPPTRPRSALEEAQARRGKKRRATPSPSTDDQKLLEQLLQSHKGAADIIDQRIRTTIDKDTEYWRYAVTDAMAAMLRTVDKVYSPDVSVEFAAVVKKYLHLTKEMTAPTTSTLATHPTHPVGEPAPQLGTDVSTDSLHPTVDAPPSTLPVTVRGAPTGDAPPQVTQVTFSPDQMAFLQQMSRPQGQTQGQAVLQALTKGSIPQSSTPLHTSFNLQDLSLNNLFTGSPIVPQPDKG